MKIVLIQNGKTNIRYISEGVDEYTSRIRKYSAFEIITVPEIKNAASMPLIEQKSREAAAIMKLIGSDDYVIALDEKGKEFRTVELAAQLQKIFLLSKKRIVFIIGGPWGFASEILARAEMRLSLSKLTFSHQLVRLLFTEQLYRAFTVIKGDPYHHE